MIDIDGMIGGLMQLVEDAHLTACLGSSCEDGIAEMILGNHLRTAECEEDTTLLNLLESLVIQAGIAFQSIMERPTVLGKGGRIENDEIVLIASLLEILEGILAESLMARIAGEIELYIAVGEFDGLGAAIDRMD